MKNKTQFKLSALTAGTMLATCLVVPTLASAGVKVDDDGKVVLHGDVRFRTEMDDRVNSGGTSQDRERMRLRARVGVKYTANEQWSGEIRLSTGNNGNSPYMTFNSGTEGEGNAGFSLNRAAINWKPIKGLVLTGGRMGLKFWQQNEQWWDTDRSPDGIAVVYNAGGLTFNASYIVLADGVNEAGENKKSWEKDITTVMYQLVYKGKAAGLNYTAAIGGASISNADLFPNKNDGTDVGLQSDSHIIVSLQAKGNKWLAGADMIQGNADVEDTAVVLQGRFKVTDKVQLRLYHYSVEAFSTLGDGMYSQDNWPNPNDNGVSNFEGVRYQVDYKIANSTSLDLRYYDGERIVDSATLPGTASDALLNDRDRNRLQLNLTIKF